MANTHTSRKPSQKTGMEKPDTAKTITVRSIHVPCFHAASTPSGTAIVIATIIVSVASATVGSTRCLISVVTGSPEKIDVPRSPRRRLANQSESWTCNGRSSPSFARILATSSGLA
jgi:hypothetical protein